LLAKGVFPINRHNAIDWEHALILRQIKVCWQLGAYVWRCQYFSKLGIAMADFRPAAASGDENRNQGN